MLKVMASIQAISAIYATVLTFAALLGSRHVIFVVLLGYAVGLLATSVGVWRGSSSAVLASIVLYALQVVSWSHGDRFVGIRLGPTLGYRIDIGRGDLVVNVIAVAMVVAYALWTARRRGLVHQ